MKNIILCIVLFLANTNADILDTLKIKLAFELIFDYSKNWKADAQLTSIILNGRYGKASTVSVLFFSHSTPFLLFSENSMLGVKVNLNEPTKLVIEKFIDSKEYKAISFYNDRRVVSPITIFKNAEAIMNIYSQKYPENEFSVILKGERLGQEKKMLWYFLLQKINVEKRKFPLNFFINSENLDICCISCSDNELKDRVLQFLQPFEKEKGFYNINDK